jgi:two-component system cell cycle sensor histidine kinase/response regulator CckA
MAERQTRRDLEKRIDEPEKEVSQRSRAEGTLLKVSRAIEHAGGMILIADSNGIIEFVNPRFTEVTHYTKAEILGTQMTSLWEQPPDEEKQMWERLGSGAVWRGEFRGKKKDGGTYWELASISAFPDDSGAVTHLVKIAEEISDRKDLEESLRRSEEKYRRILDSMAEGYYEVDLAGNFTFINEAECRMHMRSHNELMGMSYREYMSQEDAKRTYRVFNEIYRTGVPVKLIEYDLIRKDGSLRIIEFSVSLTRNDTGDPIGFHGITRDVTERKKTEKALRESEAKYRNILESMAEGYYEVDLAGNFTFFNDALCKIHGYPREELMCLNYRKYASPETKKRIFAIYSEVYRSGVPAKIVDYEVIRKDGSVRKIETSASLLRDDSGEAKGFYGISRDVTEQKEAEKALRESEEKYRNILETMEEGYYQVDLAGNCTFFNEALCRNLGYSGDELMGMNYREYMPPETVNEIYAIYNEVYRTGAPAKVFDYDLKRKDGSLRTHAISVSLLRNASGEPIGFRGISRDRTEQKEAEKALRESEEKYRLLVENAHEGIYIVQDGVVKFPNPRAEVLTGYAAEELAKMVFLDLVHPEDKGAFLERRQKNLEGGHLPNRYSFRILNKAGETLWVELSTVLINWEGRPATLDFLRDITPQKKMEAQFLQAQKLEAIATLAGGIAHDFNNLLMGIQGNASLVLLDIEAGHPHYEKLRGIEQLVQAGSELTKQLLGAARGGKYEVRPTNLNRLVGMSSDLFGRTRKEISIHKKFQEAIWPVEVDKSQIEQVLLNLYVNAWHAMTEGGDLYLETRNVTLDEYHVKPYGVSPGRFVRISVTDTGIGMDESTRKRVFDPFFTTKEMGRGTGLGLASAYGIIRNHSGNHFRDLSPGVGERDRGRGSRS